MIRAGSVVNASVLGGTGLWEGSSLREDLIDAINQWGTVRTLTFDSKLFMSEYSSGLSFTTRYDHGNAEDIRATIAGVYQSVVGTRPAVTITSIDGYGTGETEQRPGGQFELPVQPSTLVTWAIVGIVLVALIVNAPTLLAQVKR